MPDVVGFHAKMGVIIPSRLTLPRSGMPIGGMDSWISCMGLGLC